jgi:hypothetical protein
MEPEVLRMQAQRVGRAAKAVCQQGKIAAAFDALAELHVLVRSVRSRGLAWAEQRPAPHPDPVG